MAFLRLPDLIDRIRPARPGEIYHMKSPAWPSIRFEYHPNKKKVYLVRVGTVPERGEVMAHDIENEGAAHNAVLIFLRGYRVAKGDRWDDSGKLIMRAGT
jgi:hypothetical protein